MALIVGRVLGLLVVSSAWWFVAHRIPLAHMMSCQATDAGGLFIGILVFPAFWVGAVCLTWFGTMLIVRQFRLGRARGLFALASVLVVVVVSTWAYAWFLVVTMADPYAIEHCVDPWWLPGVNPPPL
ncbi:MAG TPA: hypothetical protein VM677_34855 [Actinokineospora sp.]|nr:hypothetical protein [Actinokineospora sp.]